MLIPESPLLVLPTLATKIGLNEAIVLQQIHYWLESSAHVFEKKRWIYNSYPKWQKQFPFWSIATIKRIILKLERLEILQSGNFNKLKADRTKWYTINYDNIPDHEVNLHPPSAQDDPIHEVNLHPPIPEITTETTTEKYIYRFSDNSPMNNDNVPEAPAIENGALDAPIKEDISLLFDFWNHKKIQVHKNIDKFRSSINAALKYYNREEIEEAITNYKTVLESDDHFFSYKWSLKHFLQRGLERFLSANDPLTNFRKEKNNGNIKQGVVVELD